MMNGVGRKVTNIKHLLPDRIDPHQRQATPPLLNRQGKSLAVENFLST
jgi:hypothetical protein